MVDVMTDLRVVPGPGGKGTRVVGTAQGLGPAARQQLLRQPDRRVAADRNPARARHRRDPAPVGARALFAQAAAVGQRPAHPDGTFHIVASGRQAKYGPLQLTLDGDIDAARASTCCSPARTRRWACARCICSCSRRRPGSTIAPAAGRSLDRSPATGKSCCRTRAPPVISIAALDVGGAHASGDLRSDPAGSAAGCCSPPAPSTARSISRRSRARSASMRTSPRPTPGSRILGTQRPDRRRHRAG